MNAKQTEAQRLADRLQAWPDAEELDDAAALLIRQDKLLEQASDALETCWSVSVGLTEANWEQVKDALKSIRAHREAK